MKNRLRLVAILVNNIRGLDSLLGGRPQGMNYLSGTWSSAWSSPSTEKAQQANGATVISEYVTGWGKDHACGGAVTAWTLSSAVTVSKTVPNCLSRWGTRSACGLCKGLLLAFCSLPLFQGWRLYLTLSTLTKKTPSNAFDSFRSLVLIRRAGWEYSQLMTPGSAKSANRKVSCCFLKLLFYFMFLGLELHHFFLPFLDYNSLRISCLALFLL